MKLGIMQPYFFPYLGYFSLIKHTDRFILFDPVQFIRHGWIERNRILKPGEGWQYIQVPLVKFARETNIVDVKINNAENWKNKIVAQLQHYKKLAPYYRNVMELLDNVLADDYDDIVSFNKKSLEAVCKFLGFERNMEVYSKMNLQIEPVNAPDEWALNICKAIPGADEYINPPGGQSFFDKSKYDKNNIKLEFLEINLHEYSQKRLDFESGLSVIDVMMFNSPEEINTMLDDYKIL
jgi:hypothetical protein